mmetsp:Transcript_38054/g.81859  ORF Transcript_38054/g.81859 Transcript_38054/m.81859 type:complete len:83 (-) Transcript_38054:531-779(-)
MICQFQYGLLPWHYSRRACGMLGMNPELITGTVFCRSPAWLVSQSLAFWVWSPTEIFIRSIGFTMTAMPMPTCYLLSLQRAT